MPRYVHLGARGMGFRSLGHHRKATFSTLPKVTIGRHLGRYHIHGIDPSTADFFDYIWGASGAGGSQSPARDKFIYTRSWINPVDLLVKQLKSSGIWDLCNLIYPFVGYFYRRSLATWMDGVNIKSPGTNTLSFGGNDMTHDAYGVANTSSGACDTIFSMNSIANFNWHICCYGNVPNGVMGSITCCLTSSNAAGGISMTLFNDATKTLRLVGNGVTLDAIIGARKGAFVGTRTSTTSMSIYRGGELVANSSTLTSTVLPNHSQKLMYQESGTTNFFIFPFNFCSMGTGLTDDQAFWLSQIVQDYQTRMGRGV